MMNPSITQALADQHRADMRREAARQRLSRQSLHRRPARHRVIHPVVIPAARTGEAEHAEARDSQELCLTGRR